MTSLAEERAEQERWNVRLRRPRPQYDQLVENEFRSPEERSAWTAQKLRAMLRFAAREVPHYRDKLRGAGADAVQDDPMSALAALPILSKLDVMDSEHAFRAEHLPPGEQPGMAWRSSGTTGRPISVLYSQGSGNMYNFLAQRSCRWQRLDPSGKFAEMRIPSLLPLPDGQELAHNQSLSLHTWRGLEHFSTGPYVCTSVMASVERRIEWLRRERPDYLMTYSETLELLARAAGDERPADSLKAVVAISEQLTPGMRVYVERRFGTPVHQVYGLMEFGLVGVRCDAGRYHVHSEHCLAEIVDESGRRCTPGQTGRIVITTLTNVAMPLIRYDTGDLAEAVSDPCPCNRTLPSFGDIVGRYSRIAFLPPNTLQKVMALREAIENMPIELARDLREFQVHQFADQRMELRYVARSRLPDAFFEHLRGEWAKAADPAEPVFTARRVDEIPRAPGGKTEVFTSDLMPARNEKPATG
jgi:phenylacetate-CoA ligase